MQMLDRLDIVKQRFDEVNDLIIQPDIISDQKRYIQINKEYKDLRVLMEKREEYITLSANISEAEEIIQDGSDAEMVEMAKMELLKFLKVVLMLTSIMIAIKMLNERCIPSKQVLSIRRLTSLMQSSSILFPVKPS